MKPEGAMEFGFNIDICVPAIHDAIKIMESQPPCLFNISVPLNNINFTDGRIDLNKEMNILGYYFHIQVLTDFNLDEWMIKDTVTGKVVWNPGV